MRGEKGKKSEGKKISSTGSSEAEEKAACGWVRASTARNRKGFPPSLLPPQSTLARWKGGNVAVGEKWEVELRVACGREVACLCCVGLSAGVGLGGRDGRTGRREGGTGGWRGGVS
jgi:hypothetical protein